MARFRLRARSAAEDHVKWMDFVPVNGVVLAQGLVVELTPG
jgi:hypothetical protein